MNDFNDFRELVKIQLDKVLEADQVFRVDISKGFLSKVYLQNIPKHINPIFRTKHTYDCSCCNSFIEDVGSIVSLNTDGSYNTIWDIEYQGDFQEVVKSLALAVRQAKISNVFLTEKSKVGTKTNIAQLEGDSFTTSFEHLYGKIPKKFKRKLYKLPTLLGDTLSKYTLFERGLNTISISALDTVIDLVGKKSSECQINRGHQNLGKLLFFKKLLSAYKLLENCPTRTNFIWQHIDTPETVTSIRNSVIGTLLVDISEGMDVSIAIEKYEKKVDPTNYRRSSSIVTSKMRESAMEFAAKENLDTALQRRYATFDDIHITNVIYANQQVQAAKSVFDLIPVKVATNLSNSGEVIEVSLEKFIKDVIPFTNKLEILFQHSMQNKLVSLIAPEVSDSVNILKWDNNYSWSYVGEVTDSIVERVKKRGGEIDAELRISLAWSNSDDLDLYLSTPNDIRVYYGDIQPLNTQLNLNVDMNVSGSIETENFSSIDPVENISCTYVEGLEDGVHTVGVHQYTKRNNLSSGFTIEVDFKGTVTTYTYDKILQNKEDLTVLEFEYFHETDTIKLNSDLSIGNLSKDIWGIGTESFHEVNMLTFSPNYWDGQAIGEKHIFFLMEDCLNPEGTRGLYTEFLSDKFHPHRKTFEVLGDVLKVQPSTTSDQLSGLGFALGNRSKVTCRISNDTSSRIYDIQI